MSQHIDAIYINGVFRPEQPVNMADGQRVALTIDTRTDTASDEELADLRDSEFIEVCRRKAVSGPSLEEVRRQLDRYPGSVADLISQERDER